LRGPLGLSNQNPNKRELKERSMESVEKEMLELSNQNPNKRELKGPIIVLLAASFTALKPESQ